MRAPVVPQNLDLALTTSLRKVLFQKMVLTDFTGSLSVAKGTVSMNRLSMNAFDGRMSASGSYSTAADEHRPALKLQAEIRRRFVLRDLRSVGRRPSGWCPCSRRRAATIPCRSTSRPASRRRWSPIMRRCRPRARSARRTSACRMSPCSTGWPRRSRTTICAASRAKDVAIRFTIRDGRIATQPFDLKMGGLALTLSGSTGLDQTIDYTARVKLPEGTAGGVLKTVDVGIGGTFASPQLTLDVKNAVKDAVTETIGHKLGLSLGSDEGRSADEIPRRGQGQRQTSSSRRPKRSATSSWTKRRQAGQSRGAGQRRCAGVGRREAGAQAHGAGRAADRGAAAVTRHGTTSASPIAGTHSSCVGAGFRTGILR